MPAYEEYSDWYTYEWHVIENHLSLADIACTCLQYHPTSLWNTQIEKEKVEEEEEEEGDEDQEEEEDQEDQEEEEEEEEEE